MSKKEKDVRIHSYLTTGIDISQPSKLPNSKHHSNLVADFFNMDKLPPKSYGFHQQELWKLRNDDNSATFPPALVLCNPPFNGYKNKLAPEVWLDKIIELFGKDIPIVLFAPMGFRLNGKKNGQRWTKFTNDKYPPISSIISLPRDIFPEVEFHSEILIFNIKGLEPHYFFNHEPN